MSVHKTQKPVKKIRRKTPTYQHVLSTSFIVPAVIIAAGLFSAAMSYIIMHSSAAIGTATLYTSPGINQSVDTGEMFEVDIRINTAAGVPVKGASIYLDYVSDKIEFQSVSLPSSPYSTVVQETNTGGVLHLERTATPAVPGGDELFARISFKAINTGSAQLNFMASSYVTSEDDGSNLPLQSNGVTYTINAPASSPSAPPIGSNPGAPATSTSPGAPAATAPSNGGAGTGRNQQSQSTSQVSSGSPIDPGTTPVTSPPAVPAANATNELPVSTNGEGSVNKSQDSSGISTISKVAIATGGLVAVAGLLLGAKMLWTQLAASRSKNHIPIFSTPAISTTGAASPPTESKILEERLERLRNFPTTTLAPGAMVGPTDVSSPAKPAQPSVVINNSTPDK